MTSPLQNYIIPILSKNWISSWFRWRHQSDSATTQFYSVQLVLIWVNFSVVFCSFKRCPGFFLKNMAFNVMFTTSTQNWRGTLEKIYFHIFDFFFWYTRNLMITARLYKLQNWSYWEILVKHHQKIRISCTKSTLKVDKISTAGKM